MMGPLHFTHVCQLLQELEATEERQPPLLKHLKSEAKQRCVERWFCDQRERIFSTETNGAALLAILIPYRRADRVFNIKTVRLARIVRRVLGLSAWKVKELEKVKNPGFGDLGKCLERVLKDTDSPARPGVLTINELDRALTDVASKSPFSDPDVKNYNSKEPLDKILGPVLLKLYSWELKWLVRIILKDFLTVALDDHIIMREYHFLLPDLLRFQNNLTVAVGLLQTSYAGYPRKPDPQSQKQFRRLAYKDLHPKIGVKVERQNFQKAWSIKHCLQSTGENTWSVERKYDGEYCEIHINLEDPTQLIKIFSKSGKDSTNDRRGIHKTICESLRVGCDDCGFKKRCILLGEILVYSEKKANILDFHEIRKHVTRSERRIGAALDTKPDSLEHLMIVYFDVLLLDNDAVMNKSYRDRRTILSSVITKRVGRAMTAERASIDFKNKRSKRLLLDHFALSVHARHEGLILKPLDAPYFSFDRKVNLIKLKKDYMQDMGGLRDTADLCVVGATYEADQALKTRLNIKWTTFFIGCLTNKHELGQSHEPRRVFKVVAAIRQEFCIPNPILRTLNEIGQLRALYLGNHASDELPFRVIPLMDAAVKMQVLFNEPMIVEVLGSGFSVPGNEDFFTLRHPRILKFFNDRTFTDCVDMDGLAALAKESKSLSDANDEGELVGEIDWRVQEWKKRVAAQMSGSRETTSTRSSACAEASSPRKRRNQARPSTSPSLIREDTTEKHKEAASLLIDAPDASPNTPLAVLDQNSLPGREQNGTVNAIKVGEVVERESGRTSEMNSQCSSAYETCLDHTSQDHERPVARTTQNNHRELFPLYYARGGSGEPSILYCPNCTFASLLSSQHPAAPA